jgi:hypothetical protein
MDLAEIRAEHSKVKHARNKGIRDLVLQYRCREDDGHALRQLMVDCHHYGRVFDFLYHAIDKDRDPVAASWCKHFGTRHGHVVPLLLATWNQLRHGVGSVATLEEVTDGAYSAFLLLLRVAQDVCATEAVLGSSHRRAVYSKVHGLVATWLTRWPHLPLVTDVASSLQNWLVTRRTGGDGAGPEITPSGTSDIIPAGPHWAAAACVDESWMAYLSTAPRSVVFSSVGAEDAAHLDASLGRVKGLRASTAKMFLAVLNRVPHDDLRLAVAALSSFPDDVAMQVLG